MCRAPWPLSWWAWPRRWSQLQHRPAIVRVVVACCTALAAILGVVAVILVLVDPGGALGALVAAGAGRTGSLTVHGRVGLWVVLAAMLVMGIGAVAALVGGWRWRGCGSWYEAVAPTARGGSTWDQLSRGEAPTAGQ